MTSTPKLAPDSSFEDLNELDNDINNLFNTYVKPIDAIRSKAMPILSSDLVKDDNSLSSALNSDFKNLEISSKPLESRCHAFYRMLGLPVVDEKGNFYNPGFDFSGGDNKQKQAVQNNIINGSKTLQNLITNREKYVKEVSNMFNKQDFESSVYGILLRHPIPFKLIEDDKEPLYVDKQTFANNDRETAAFILSSYNINFSEAILDIGKKYKTIQHVLKPFIVDFRIENCVTPSDFKICVPFLKDKKQTKIDNNYCLRPGLELILRQRLSDNNQDINFLKAAQNLLEQDSKVFETTVVSSNLLVNTVQALAEEKVSNSNIQDILSNVSNVQIKTIAKLIKTMQIAVRQMLSSCNKLDQVSKTINFFPLFGVDGPITGSLNGKVKEGLKTSANNIDQKITELKIKKLNSERNQINVENLGEFASPFVQNVFSENSVSVDDQLREISSFKDRLVKDGLDFLKTIEIVKGEVAGIGLVDILAVYIALWSIDLDVLLTFLDDVSFNRMVINNPSFKDIEEVSDRINGIKKYTIFQALKKFEEKVSEMLNLADLYSQNALVANF